MSATAKWTERVATGTGDREISGPGGGVCVIPYRYGTPERRAALSRAVRAVPRTREALRRLEDIAGRLAAQVAIDTGVRASSATLVLAAVADACSEARAALAEMGGVE